MEFESDGNEGVEEMDVFPTEEMERSDMSNVVYERPKPNSYCTERL